MYTVARSGPSWDSREPTLWKKNWYRLAVICIDYPDIQHNEKVTAKDVQAHELIMGASNKYTADEQLEQIAFYWISLHDGNPAPLTVSPSATVIPPCSCRVAPEFTVVPSGPSWAVVTVGAPNPVSTAKKACPAGSVSRATSKRISCENSLRYSTVHSDLAASTSTCP